MVKTEDPRTQYPASSRNLKHRQHPIHIHGHAFRVTATDGGQIPQAGQWPETTVLVPVGATRDVEFIADAPGDWAFHCHKSHHTMNPMGHDVPNTLGVNQKGLEAKMPGHASRLHGDGRKGMAEHADVDVNLHGRVPKTPSPMIWARGLGNIEMGGMFTVVKVRTT